MFRSLFTKTEPIKPETPAQMLKRIEAEAEAERVRMKLDDEKRERAERIRAERVKSITAETETVKTEAQQRRADLTEGTINYGPLVLISGLAITGQFGSFSTYLEPTFDAFAPVVAAVMALGLEFIALFLGMHGMKALRRRDSAAGLLLSATAVAALVAYLNFDHYRTTSGEASIASYAFALFSFAAPFLWRVKIRSDHRNDLATNGEIDVRGLKLPRVMWVMHPIMSYRVYRHAAWTGQRDVELAIKEWEAAQVPKEVKPIDVTPELDAAHVLAMIENLRRDFAVLDEPIENETPEIVSVPRPRALPAPRTNAPVNGYEQFMRHPKWNDGVAIFSASMDAGTPLKVTELATELGLKSRVLAGKIKQYVEENRKGKGNDSDDDDGTDLSAEVA